MPRETRQLAPRVLGANSEKLANFRIQQNIAVGNPLRYPIGRFPFMVDVSFAGKTPTRTGALRINTFASVKNSANKITSKKLWGDCIPHSRPFKELKAFVFDGEFRVDQFEELFIYPLVAKRTNTSKGKGFTYIKSYEDLENFLSNAENAPYFKHYYFESFFEFDKEYRVHVSPWLQDRRIIYNYTRPSTNGIENIIKDTSNGCIFMSQKKLKQEAYDRGVRHTTRGGKYDDIVFSSRFTPQSWMNSMIHDAIEAIKLLGLDFGFIDVGYNSSTNQYVFFESGCNPELTNPEIQCYKQALQQIILYKAENTNFMPRGYVHRVNQTRNLLLTL